MVLYKFMDKLCERGYEVFAITPEGKVQWKPGFSSVLVARFNASLESGDSQGIAHVKAAQFSPVERVLWTTRGLLENWVQSEVTICTFGTFTSYANYLLMDKTIPMYHMQGYEEYLFDSEILRKLARLTYYLPLELVANCTSLQNEIKQRLCRQSHLLNPGIDTEVFRPCNSIGDKYKVPSRTRVASYYSPLKTKGWGDAVEAMKTVFHRVGYDRLEWIVFGSSPPSENVPVKYLGRIFGDSLAKLYSSAHIVFTSSWYESFPLPPLEAMACGTAVVTTRIGTEDYAFHGENSLVVPAGRPQVLADAIIQLIEQPSLARRLAENGLRTVHEFTWDRAVNRLEEIIRAAISGHRTPFTDLAVPHSDVLEELNQAVNRPAELRTRLTRMAEMLQNAKDELERTKHKLAKTDGELDAIKGSFGYNLMRVYGSNIDRLFPEKTRRGEFRNILARSLGTVAHNVFHPSQPKAAVKSNDERC